MKTVMYEAPDISVHNGNINFKAVRDVGYNSVYIRAGYGKGNVDQKYIVNAEACRNLGIFVVLYWFSYALNESMSENEAVYAVKQARKYWENCPIAYDLEYDTVRYAATKGVKIDKTLATNMAIAFLKKVKSEGYTPVIYLNKDYKQNYFDMVRIRKEISDVKIWYARYNDTISEAELSDTDIWQYTSKGRVSGISGNVDINKVYTDLMTLQGIQVSQSEKKASNLYILGFQKAANKDGYRDSTGSKLVEDGIDGCNTQAVRRRVNLKAKEFVFVGSKGELVKWWQQRLNEIMKTNLEIDGLFGQETRTATIAFQRRYNLRQDGIAGYNTLQMAFYN